MTPTRLQRAVQFRAPARISRRRILQGAAAGALVALVGGRAHGQQKSKNAGIKKWPKPPPGVKKPRYKRQNGAKVVGTNLTPGFYLNPKPKVVHYVARDGKIRAVQRINTERLKPLSIAEVTNLVLNDVKPRVHLTTASRVLEEAALEQFQANQPDVGFQLLGTAIRHDLLLKERSREMPSLRLYDLYAAKAIQLGDKARLNELVNLALQGDTQVTKAAASRVGNIKTPQAKSPPSEFAISQRQRKTVAKAAAINARKTSYSPRLKKWAGGGRNPWKGKWESRNKTWKL
jgi:hypothetical protein